jgi:hypothetical protein
MFDTGSKEMARLVVMPGEKVGQFPGIITKGSIEVVKTGITG